MFSQGIYDLRHESWRSRHGESIVNIPKPQKVHFRWVCWVSRWFVRHFRSFFNVIVAHVLTTKPHLSIQNRVWDHPHGGKPYQESFFDALKPPKHRFRLVFYVLRLDFWVFLRICSNKLKIVFFFQKSSPYRETLKKHISDT